MKKIIYSLFCLILMLGILSGCSPKAEENLPVSDRTVILDEIGLTYTVPDSWMAFEETNIVPISLTGDYTFAEIIYLYVTQEDLRKVNSGEATFQTVGEPIFEIAVVNTEEFDPESTHKAIFSFFNSHEIVGEEGDYTYYLFYDSKHAPNRLESSDLENYNQLVETIPELKGTIETRAFDDTPIQNQIDYFNQYITFDTEIIDGTTPVMSTIFADYDLCMVNFGTAGGYPETNEFETLSSVNFLASQMPSFKLGVIHIVADSWDKKCLEAAITAKNKADAKVITLKGDAYTESWLEKNVNSMPATVFVDSSGKIIGDAVEGVKTHEEYMALFMERIELMKADQE